MEGVTLGRRYLPDGFPEETPKLFVDKPVQHGWVEATSGEVKHPRLARWNKYRSSLAEIVREVKEGLRGFPVSKEPATNGSEGAAANGRVESEEQQGLQRVMSQVEAMTDEQLQGLLSNTDVLDHFAAEAALDQDSQKRAAIIANRQLAEECQEAAKRVLQERDSARVVRSSSLLHLEGALEEQRSRQRAIMDRFSPEILLQHVEQGAQSAAREASSAHARILAGEAALDDFRSARYLHHYRRILADVAREDLPGLHPDGINN